MALKNCHRTRRQHHWQCQRNQWQHAAMACLVVQATVFVAVMPRKKHVNPSVIVRRFIGMMICTGMGLRMLRSAAMHYCMYQAQCLRK